MTICSEYVLSSVCFDKIIQCCTSAKYFLLDKLRCFSENITYLYTGCPRKDLPKRKLYISVNSQPNLIIFFV